MKTISLQSVVDSIPNGASLMIGGFMGVGTPEPIIDELVREQSIQARPAYSRRSSHSRPIRPQLVPPPQQRQAEEHERTGRPNQRE